MRSRWFIVFGLVATLGFCALGWWQIQRRAWKLDLIERVEARVHAPAVTAPVPAEWYGLNVQAAEYRHVQVTGRFLNDLETPVLAVTERGRGYWIVTPLQTASGTVVLVNRGYVPTDKRDPSSRPGMQPIGVVQVTGLLRLSEVGGGFLRVNNPQENRWYSRDVATIAQARGLKDVAPYFIDAGAADNAAELPVGGLTRTSFPNNHLVYALTWFAMALLAGWMTWMAWRSHD